MSLIDYISPNLNQFDYIRVSWSHVVGWKTTIYFFSVFIELNPLYLEQPKQIMNHLNPPGSQIQELGSNHNLIDVSYLTQ